MAQPTTERTTFKIPSYDQYYDYTVICYDSIRADL